MKTRVILILSKLELGGAQKVCLAVFSDLMKRKDVEVSLVVGEGGVLIPQAKAIGPVKFVKALDGNLSLSSFGAMREIFFYLRKLKRSNARVVVNTHSTKAGAIGRVAAWLAGCDAIVHTVHGFGFHSASFFLKRWFFIVIEQFCTLLSTWIICVSQKDIDQGEKLFLGFGKKAKLIRAGIAMRKEKCLAFSDGLPKDEFVIGSVSCFKPQKNLLDLIVAFSRVHKKYSQARLEIVGDGVLREDIEREVEKQNLGIVVRLWGWQSDVVTIMQRWHLFALSSLWEGLPCSVVEARVLALPVVANDVGGISEVIFPSKNGFLVAPHDVDGLISAMTKLVGEKGLWQRLSHFCDDLESFSQKKMTQQYFQLLTMP